MVLIRAKKKKKIIIPKLAMWDNVSDHAEGPVIPVLSLGDKFTWSPCMKIDYLKPQPILHNITFVDELLLSLPIKFMHVSKNGRPGLQSWILCVTDGALCIV